jgi:hypothetical protein
MMQLSAMLREAETASPMQRIEWRDKIAAYGARAIEEVQPWLRSPTLAAFAIRVIERAGIEGEPLLATQVLKSSRAKVPSTVKGDVDWALRRLRALSSDS